jgi:pyridoxal phosphate enzyme (YggS family)
MSSREDELAANLAEVDARISAACTAAGRPRDGVTLIAITKTWPISDCELLRDLGVTDLGENRDQEAAEKAAAVHGVRWHFVGAVQTNKARSVAAYADVVHSVDRPSLVSVLGDGAVRAARVVDVLLQVSLDGDPARGGAAAEDVPGLAEQVVGTAGLRLAGVMAVAPLGADAAPAFERLAEVSARLRASHPTATVISAGMTGDLEQAVRAGATHVRVGTAVLGARPAPLR